MPDSEWSDLAACKSHPELDWYTFDQDDMRLCINVCKTECTVRAQCLAFAKRTGESHGIWGGESFDTPIRKVYRRKSPTGLTLAQRERLCRKCKEEAVPKTLNGELFFVCLKDEIKWKARFQ
jgi:hypothetical protein